MIIIQFAGGLGNQISQYAMGKLLYTINPFRQIKYDLSTYQNTKVHNGFELHTIFKGTTINVASELEKFKLTRVIPTSNLKQLNSLIYKIQKLIPVQNIYNQKYESGYPEDPTILSPHYLNKYLIGTFHNYNYDCVIEKLRKELTFPTIKSSQNIELLQKIKQTNSISIHVRKGDYTNTDLDITNIDYYKSAINIIKNNINDPYFYIFSDDSNYIKKTFTFLNKNYKIIDWNKNKDSYLDMQLMSECKHNIIANSTFSYWAAYINSNKNKIVIRPQKQTKDRYTWNKEGWISI